MPQGVCISWFGCQVAESELVSAQILRDDIRGGKSDKQIYDRLTTEYGKSIPYSALQHSMLKRQYFG